MPRYIDADKLIDAIKAHDYLLVAHNNSIDRGMFTAGIQQVIDETPTAEVEPVKRGKWLSDTCNMYGEGSNAYTCSVCGEPWTLNDGIPTENNMHYCPNCGAKIEG